MATEQKQFEICYNGQVYCVEGKSMANAVLEFVKVHNLGSNIERVKASDIKRVKEPKIEAWINGGQSDKYKMYTGRYASIYTYKILA